jgi:hypothetical protein
VADDIQIRRNTLECRDFTVTESKKEIAMYTKEYYIEQLTDLGVNPKAWSLPDGLESATLEQLQDLLDIAMSDDHEAIVVADLPDDCFDPDDQRDYGRFSW